MTKAELRTSGMLRRQTITSIEQTKLDDLLLIQFQRLKLPFINTVHSYLASENLKEIETGNIIRYLEFSNPDLIVSVPRISESGMDLQHVIIHEATEFKINRYGIVEPVDGVIIDPLQIDLVLTPLLAFDTNGYRVGYGKGFYDKFFSQCRSDIVKIGLCYFEAEDIISDINEYDIPLDFCVTPHKLYEFTS